MVGDVGLELLVLASASARAKSSLLITELTPVIFPSQGCVKSISTCFLKLLAKGIELE